MISQPANTKLSSTRSHDTNSEFNLMELSRDTKVQPFPIPLFSHFNQIVGANIQRSKIPKSREKLIQTCCDV